MKKVLISLTAVGVLALSLFVAACGGGTAGYEKVAEKSYEYVEVTYKAEGLSASETATLDLQLTRFRNNEEGMVIRFTADTAYYKQGDAAETEYSYKQVAGDIVVFDGPYRNTNYEGEVVCGYTIDKSAETLTFHNGMTFPETGRVADVYITYKLIQQQQEVTTE